MLTILVKLLPWVGGALLICVLTRAEVANRSINRHEHPIIKILECLSEMIFSIAAIFVILGLIFFVGWCINLWVA